MKATFSYYHKTLTLFGLLLFGAFSLQAQAEEHCINYSGPTENICGAVYLSAGCLLGNEDLSSYCTDYSRSITWYRNNQFLSYGSGVYATQSGQYHYEIEYQYGCGFPCGTCYAQFSSESINLNFYTNPNTFPIPSVTTNPNELCPGSTTMLSVYGSLPSDVEWVWYEGGTTNQIGTGNIILVSPENSTVYYVRAENNCGEGNLAYVPVNIKQFEEPTGATASFSTICNGESVDLSLQGTPNETSEIWWYSDEALTQQIGTGQDLTVSPSATTTYYGVYYYSSCHYTTASRSVTVSVNEISVDAGAETYVLYGSSSPAVTQYNCVTLTASGVTGGTAPYEYSWNGEPFSSNPDHVVCPTADTEYTVTVKDANGCTASDIVNVKAFDVSCGNGGDKVGVCITTPSGNTNTVCVNSNAVDNFLSSNPNATLGNCNAFKTGDITAVKDKFENYPNPLVNTTTFSIEVAQTGKYALHIYDVTGRKMTTVFNKELESGSAYNITFNASSLPIGTYVCVLEGNNKQMMNKIMILR